MKKVLNIEIKLPLSEETQSIIEDAGFDDMGYDKKWGNYRLRLTKTDIKAKREILKNLIELAYKSFK